MLSKLAQHYYRPDFTDAQARTLIEDYLHDLMEFDLEEVEFAIATYRTSDERFFPRSGQLRKIIATRAAERAATARICDRPLPDSRPHFWWLQDHWKPSWKESEIPEEHRSAYEKRKARPRPTGAGYDHGPKIARVRL